MTTEEQQQPEKQHEDPSALSFDVGRAGLRIRLPEKLFRYVGPKAIPWSILMISAAVALYILAKAAALVVGAGNDPEPKHRNTQPVDGSDGLGSFLPYRRGTAPGVQFWV